MAPVQPGSALLAVHQASSESIASVPPSANSISKWQINPAGFLVGAAPFDARIASTFVPSVKCLASKPKRRATFQPPCVPSDWPLR